MSQTASPVTLDTSTATRTRGRASRSPRRTRSCTRRRARLPARQGHDVPTDPGLDRGAIRAGRPGGPGRLRTTVSAGGLAMATGAAAWALGTLVYDLDPVTDDFPWVYKLSSLLFQLGSSRWSPSSCGP